MAVVFRSEAQLNRVLLIKLTVFFSVILVCAPPTSMPASDQPFHSNSDAITQVEDALKRAAVDPSTSHRQEAIEREVLDITFLLDQSRKAAKKSDEVARKEYAQHALSLLERSAARGYFDLGKAKPVLMLIGQLLSDEAN